MTVINWNPPTSTKPDWLIGAGATRAERSLVWIASAIGAGYVAWQWATGEPGNWSWWQYIVAAAIWADLVGGAVANAASSTKRQYFGPLVTPPRGFTVVLRSPIAFASLHIYPFLIALLYPGDAWVWAIAAYLAMLIPVIVVDRFTPQYLQRPMAMLLFVVSLIALLVFFTAPAGWEWVAIPYLAKLILAHGVKEEPYRPREDS